MTLEQLLDKLIKEVSDPKFWSERYWNRHSYGNFVKGWADKINGLKDNPNFKKWNVH